MVISLLNKPYNQRRSKKTDIRHQNVRKVNDIDPAKYKADVVIHISFKAYKKDFTVEEKMKITRPVCSFFGCGKKLTLIDSLCGDKCLNHQGEQVDITNYMSL